ncbi:hypothetical protein J6590_090895 [Homalodisca vitripennis]|nr:hypothetical protein J6590_080614 [Homalodisca vitripennis]KAG8309240.1 hypothetical protein J6590_090895 [Homalodisca vitripennis]
MIRPHQRSEDLIEGTQNVSFAGEQALVNGMERVADRSVERIDTNCGRAFPCKRYGESGRPLCGGLFLSQVWCLHSISICCQQHSPPTLENRY